MKYIYFVIMICSNVLLAGCNSFTSPTSPVSLASSDSFKNIAKATSVDMKIEAARVQRYTINNDSSNASNDKLTNSSYIQTSSAPTNLDTKEYNWYFKPQGKGILPLYPNENNFYKNDPNCIYFGDSSKKNLYLTFDEGYENGYTTTVLDILKKHNIKAAFFVVKPYITSNPELIQRMVDEGHLVCNHSARHPSMAAITNQQKFNKELIDVEEAYENLTKQKMPKFFRPPMGKYSQLSLKYTSEFGYKTVFWGFAYMDWDVNHQPSKAHAKDKILSRIYNGAIILLHSVSKTNAEILDEIIIELKAQGYEFKTLYDIK
jgi:peptidoglycan-N-acetylmuramic acid deacetylase